MSATGGAEDSEKARLEKLKAERMALLESLAKLDNEMESVVSKAMEQAVAVEEANVETQAQKDLYNKNAVRKKVDPLHSEQPAPAPALHCVNYTPFALSSVYTNDICNDCLLTCTGRACFREVGGGNRKRAGRRSAGAQFLILAFRNGERAPELVLPCT
jgi:hypothetical protein